jgi:hypothetical protein
MQRIIVGGADTGDFSDDGICANRSLRGGFLDDR